MSDRLVLIPTYNEKENIERIIETVFSLDLAFDILVIDDNSPDGTRQIVKRLQEKYDALHMLERPGKEGLGRAYLDGFSWALSRHYNYIFEMDADFSHNPHDLPKLYNACTEQGGDMAVGSRYVNGVNVVNWPIKRVLLSYFASSYVRRITGMPVRDSTAGFVCYTRKVLETINLSKIKFKGYAFQIEMKFTTWKFGFNIVEVPIIFTDRSEGNSKMSKGIVREAIFGVIQLKIWSLFNKYNRTQ
ncbi:MAG: polyprenol monophosphomannose synthase [Bacteroidetes bacterium]|nr:polyprenol monophosphomannose synthase [Bacteroidota bacterium]